MKNAPGIHRLHRGHMPISNHPVKATSTPMTATLQSGQRIADESMASWYHFSPAAANTTTAAVNRTTKSGDGSAKRLADRIRDIDSSRKNGSNVCGRLPCLAREDGPSLITSGHFFIDKHWNSQRGLDAMLLVQDEDLVSNHLIRFLNLHNVLLLPLLTNIHCVICAAHIVDHCG